jgi:ribonuclease HI
VKFYVVWKGRQTGIFSTWAECERQIKGFPNAEFKAFKSRAEAEAAWQGSYADRHTVPPAAAAPDPERLRRLGVRLPCVVVDAACAGNPGPLEYRGVAAETGERLFAHGPFPAGTNNIGEFLALVEALAWLEARGLDWPVYSDSVNALNWVKAGRCRTQQPRTARNAPLFDRIAQAEAWLARHKPRNPLLKWQTEAWGEIPADYGRK